MGWKVDAVSGGPTTIVWGPDVVGLAKQAIKWAKEFPGTVVKGDMLAARPSLPKKLKC